MRLSNGRQIPPLMPDRSHLDTGINCAGPPGFPEVQTWDGIAQIHFRGNTAGDTNCP